MNSVKLEQNKQQHEPNRTKHNKTKQNKQHNMNSVKLSEN